MIRTLIDTYRNVKDAYTGSLVSFIWQSFGCAAFIFSITVFISIIEVLR